MSFSLKRPSLFTRKIYVGSFIEHTTPCQFFFLLILLLTSPSLFIISTQRKKIYREKDKATVEEKEKPCLSMTIVSIVEDDDQTRVIRLLSFFSIGDDTG